jgi:hypothetical protein
MRLTRLAKKSRKHTPSPPRARLAKGARRGFHENKPRACPTCWGKRPRLVFPWQLAPQGKA